MTSPSRSESLPSTFSTVVRPGRTPNVSSSATGARLGLFRSATAWSTCSGVACSDSVFSPLALSGIVSSQSSTFSNSSAAIHREPFATSLRTMMLRLTR